MGRVGRFWSRPVRSGCRPPDGLPLRPGWSLERDLGRYGGGGGGGNGVVFTGTGTVTIGAAVRGGNGGAGGNGSASGTAAGSGGFGGNGLVVSKAGVTVNVNASITGGNGGASGSIGRTDQQGLGGVGIVGSGLTVIAASSISGGLAADLTTRANAITFTGGTNVLELQAGSNITGNVVAFSTADTLRLGGTANASFDVSQIGPPRSIRASVCSKRPAAAPGR